jgi:hypothetical protein
MKKLFRVACSGMCYSITTFSDIYVIADSYQEASDKALSKMKELKYDKVDDFVSSIELIADEKESNKKLLIP